MDSSLLVAAGAGIAIGVFADILFVHGSMKNNASNSVSIYGMNANSLIANVLFGSLVLSLVVFAGLSYVVQDLKYPREHPISFTLETLCATFVPGLILYVIMLFRGVSITTHRHLEYLAMSVKFGLLHIMFQFSGVYTYALSY
jgi:hypothetical protein